MTKFKDSKKLLLHQFKTSNFIEVIKNLQESKIEISVQSLTLKHINHSDYRITDKKVKDKSAINIQVDKQLFFKFVKYLLTLGENVFYNDEPILYHLIKTLKVNTLELVLPDERSLQYLDSEGNNLLHKLVSFHTTNYFDKDLPSSWLAIFSLLVTSNVDFYHKNIHQKTPLDNLEFRHKSLVFNLLNKKYKPRMDTFFMENTIFPEEVIFQITSFLWTAPKLEQKPSFPYSYLIDTPIN
jgi:hypothetical protein